MPRLPLALTLAAAALMPAASASAQATMTPLSTFGTNGWIAPGASAYVTTGHTERGLAYNPVTGNLVLVSRAGGNNIRILDGATGADLGGLDITGITGGTYLINMAGIDDAGAVYVGNLSTSATSPFKIYRWDSEATGPFLPPTVAYDSLSGLARTGDAFAVLGGTPGNPALFAAAGSTNVNASCFLVGTLDGTNTSTAYLSVPGTGTTSNDYRLALSFVDSGTLIGNQGGLARLTAFGGTTASVTASIPFGSSAMRALDYTVIGGVPVLAVIDTNSSVVTVFDVTNPATPLLLASATNTSTPVGNPNGTGSVQWGPVSGNSAILYAMSTNQGIQAFQVFLGAPASATAYGTGCGSPALTLDSTGAPLLPSTFDLVVDNLPPGTLFGSYAFGYTSIPAGAAIPVAPGCLQYLVPLAGAFFVPSGTSHQLSQTMPNAPAAAGIEIFVQAVVLDPNSTILATNGLALYLETF